MCNFVDNRGLIKDIIEKDISTCLVTLFGSENADVIIELCGVIIQIYQQANEDQVQVGLTKPIAILLL